MANPFTSSANQIGATGVGLADLWAQIVGQSEQDALARIQQLGLAPPEALGQGAQQGADILSALNAQIPAQALGQTGSAWDQFMGAAPGYIQGITNFEGQLQQQQLSQNAQMNALSQQASAASSGGGSGGEGLTPYQYFQVQADMADRAYRQEQDALDREFEMAKFGMGEEEKAREDQAFVGLMTWVLQDAGFTPKQIKNILPGIASSGATGLGAITGIVGDQKDAADDAADDAKAAASAKQERRQDLRETITGFDLGDFPNKNAATQALSNEIQTLYPNFAGLKEGRVNALIRNRVNSGWAGRGGTTGGGSGAGADNWSGVGKLMNSYWKDIKDVKGTESVTNAVTGESEGTRSVTRRVSYKTAFAQMYGRIADEYKLPNGRWKRGLNEKKVRAKVHGFLRRQKLKRPPRRNVPSYQPNPQPGP